MRFREQIEKSADQNGEDSLQLRDMFVQTDDEAELGAPHLLPPLYEEAALLRHLRRHRKVGEQSHQPRRVNTLAGLFTLTVKI